MPQQIPSRTRIVVVGGGIVGCSIAYHLTKVGISDVVLLERKRLTSGTTWHAAGLVGQMRPSKNQTQLQRYGVRLFKSLEDETGQSAGVRQSGGISVALDEARFEILRRAVSFAQHLGMADARIISRDELGGLWPPLNLEGIVGASYVPSNVQINPVDATLALAKGARMGGAQIFENTKVSRILTAERKVIGVETDAGAIQADTIVLACGMWTRTLAAQCNVTVPLHAAEHFYLVTEPIPDLPKLPSILLYEERAYYKEDAGKLLIGAFESTAVPWATYGIPEDSEFETLPTDYDRYSDFLETASERIPLLKRTGIQTFFIGPESFTPDGRALMGEAPELRNLFICAGFNSTGIMSSPGAGKVMAEWIRNAAPPFGIFAQDVRRMMPFQRTRRYLYDRTTESLGLLMDMPWPTREMRTARGVRRFPLHRELIDAGAYMGERFGWEMPLFYMPRSGSVTIRPKLGHQDWYPRAREECCATRDAVAFYDETSLAKILVQGPGACRALNWISANNVDVPIGRVVYTQWLNTRGGIEADLTINRLAEEAFLVVTTPASQVRDIDWLRRHSPEDPHFTFTDVTNGYAMFGVMGPKSRELLQGLTDSNLSNDAVPFATSREIDLGYALVRATRLTYVGELGYELLVPTEFAAHVYEQLMVAGASFGIRHAGLYALSACRIERAYRHLGHDITEDDTPLEAGLGFAVAWDKPGGFLGRDSLLRQRERKSLTDRLVQVRLRDCSGTAPILEHNEPVWRDNVRVGAVTSGGWGFRIEASLGMAYLHNSDGISTDWITDGHYEVEVAMERYPAEVQLRPFYDPAGDRIRM